MRNIHVGTRKNEMTEKAEYSMFLVDRVLFVTPPSYCGDDCHLNDTKLNVKC